MWKNLRRGGNAIEFALTLPVFVLVLMGLADYGYLFHLQAGLDNAVTAACREGAKVDPSFGDPQATAEAELDERAALFCEIGCSSTVNDLQTGPYVVPDRTLECRITRPYEPLIGFIPTPDILSSVSYQRLEWQRSSS